MHRGNVRHSALETATLALMTAILLAVQVAFAALPNIEAVSLLIVLYTRRFHRKTLFIIYGFALLEGLLYGFGLWFINYLYVWTVLWLAATWLRHMESTIGWIVLLAAFGLSFGFLCSIPYLFIGGPSMAFSYFISGIPFDLLHCGGNAVLAALLFKPLDRVFTQKGVS